MIVTCEIFSDNYIYLFFVSLFTGKTVIQCRVNNQILNLLITVSELGMFIALRLSRVRFLCWGIFAYEMVSLTAFLPYVFLNIQLQLQAGQWYA